MEFCVSLLLGNDLAGDKVKANPRMTNWPSTDRDTALLQQEFPGVFPGCVVTRAMSKKASLKPESSVLDLSQTFMAHSKDDVSGVKPDVRVNKPPVSRDPSGTSSPKDFATNVVQPGQQTLSKNLQRSTNGVKSPDQSGEASSDEKELAKDDWKLFQVRE